MKIPPIVVEIGREAVIVVAGAAIAALVVRHWPQLKAYIKESWNG